MSSGLNLVMTVIGFAVSTMFIVFVCTRLICARIQLSASRRSYAVSSRSDLSILERGLHGLEPLVIANFPEKKFSDVFFSSSEDAQHVWFIAIWPDYNLLAQYNANSVTVCDVDVNNYSVPVAFWDSRNNGNGGLGCTVCLAEYHVEDMLRILPYCGHSFHATCIDKWLKQHSTCPVCRISLHEFPDTKPMQPMFSSAVRSHFVVESLETSYCHCISSSNGLSSIAGNDCRMEPIQENPFASDRHEGNDDVERISILIEGSPTAKDSGNKHLESPSDS